MQIDPEQLAHIVSEEVQRYLRGGVKTADAAGSACGCPLPATTGASTADGQASAVSGGMPSIAAMPAPPKAPPPTQPENPRKRVLCLFSGANEGFTVFIDTLESWLAQNIAVDGIYSGSAEYILPKSRLEGMGLRTVDDPAPFGHHFQELKNYDLILLPTLSRTVVARLALGITDNMILNLTYTCLAYGLKVMGSTDGLAPSACPVCANHLPGIPELLDDYQGRIRRLGIQLYPMGRLVTMAAQQVLGVGPIAAGADAEIIQTLITQHEAGQLPGPVIRVSRGGLVTPLARDVLAQRGIEIEVVANG